MTQSYFGTDGIRARVGQMPMVPEFVMRLGYAAGHILAQQGNLKTDLPPTVVIGKDTRISGDMLEAALEAGFTAAGINTLRAGIIPTPAVAYLTRKLNAHAGVVITASHNPFQDNGIKFFSAEGAKLPDQVERAIEEEIEKTIGADLPCVDTNMLGRTKCIDDAQKRYIEFCTNSFSSTLNLQGLKIVLDCAHGATYQVAPHILGELGATVISIGDKPDGLNINKGCGATAPKTLSQTVCDVKADLGIALDGDGDRIIMVGSTGQVYDGDQILYAIVKAAHSKQSVQGVVGTLMTNLAMEHALDALSIPFKRANVGDRYVLEMLVQQGWKFGGENSGHILCLDQHSTGDGIIAALLVLAALVTQDVTLDDYLAELKLYPQKLINIRTPQDFEWQNNTNIRQATLDAEQALASQGRILIRPSGTEPLLRVMVEGKDANLVDTQANFLAELIQNEM